MLSIVVWFCWNYDHGNLSLGRVLNVFLCLIDSSFVDYVHSVNQIGTFLIDLLIHHHLWLPKSYNITITELNTWKVSPDFSIFDFWQVFCTKSRSVSCLSARVSLDRPAPSSRAAVGQSSRRTRKSSLFPAALQRGVLTRLSTQELALAVASWRSAVEQKFKFFCQGNFQIFESNLIELSNLYSRYSRGNSWL